METETREVAQARSHRREAAGLGPSRWFSNSQIAVFYPYPLALKTTLGSLIWPRPFCHPPCLPLMCSHQAVLWRPPEWQAGRLCCDVSVHTSLRTATSSRHHRVKGYPLTWTQGRGNVTFWWPLTLSDNSACSSVWKTPPGSCRLLKLIWCLFNFAITSTYYLCFTHRETALHRAIELVVQWLKGIKQWLWYFKYWLGGIFNSFLIMKATKKPSYTTLEHLFSFLFWVDPTETEKNLRAFSLLNGRRKIKQA